MNNHRKIKKRGKFKAPSCDSPACAHNHVTGADPGSTYLDVIPEARALYKVNQGKRKISTSTVTSEEPEGVAWKRQREVRRIPHYRERRIDNDSTGSDESSDDDGDVSDGAGVPTCLPSYPFPPFEGNRRSRRQPNYRDVIDMIDVIMQDFRLKDDTYCEIMRLLDEEMGRGLRKDSHLLSTVRMYPTYVRSIPDGSERGRFLALDLGGTNFRVLLVNLKGEDAPETKSQIFLIPNRIMLGDGQLEGLASARLVRWTKGFKCANVEGEDVVRLFQEAVARKGLLVQCLAVINDPVGALMAAAHSDRNCRVGVILGTGTNCCYMEKLQKVQLWDGDEEEPREIIVNTEWGAFGDNGVLSRFRNAFDEQLDGGSLNPGHQLFEKMISGMYMGELVRLVLCELCMRGLIFSGQGSEELFTPQRFFTKYISEIESDDPNGNFSNTRLVLQELDLGRPSSDDCRHVQHVCWQVSQRAAFLAATAVATVVKRLEDNDITIAVDGSLYRFHPHFHDLMQKKVTQLIRPGVKFTLKLAHDGSGIGAALVAAVAQRMRDNSNTTPNNNENNINDTLKMDPLNEYTPLIDEMNQ